MKSEFDKVKFQHVKKVCQFFGWDEGSEQYNELLSTCDWARQETLREVKKIVNECQHPAYIIKAIEKLEAEREG